MHSTNDPYHERDASIREDLRASGERFNKTQLTNPNFKEAVQMVKAHAEQDFDAAYAEEMESLKRDCALEDERTEALRDDLHGLEAQQRDTKPYLTVSEQKGTDEKTRIPFGEWELKDQLTFSLSLIFMVLVLGAGSGNVYAAIMAEAQPVFLDHPYLAVLLACLLPSGSVALHSLGELLGSDRARGRYIRVILALTFICLLAWAVLFGLTFQIGDDAIKWEEIESQDDHTASAFTIIQLLAEMLCGASLALIAGHIHNRYHGETTVLNPEHIRLQELVADRLPVYEVRHGRRNAAWGRSMQLQAMRDVHAQEMVALFLHMRRRFDDSAL